MNKSSAAPPAAAGEPAYVAGGGPDDVVYHLRCQAGKVGRQVLSDRPPVPTSTPWECTEC